MNIDSGSFRISIKDLRSNLENPLAGSPFEERSPYRLRRCPNKSLDGAVALYFQDIAGKEGEALAKSWADGNLFTRKPYCDPRRYVELASFKHSTSDKPDPASFEGNILRQALIKCSHMFYREYMPYFLGIYALDALAIARPAKTSVSFSEIENLCALCDETAYKATEENEFPEFDWEAFKNEWFAMSIPRWDAG